MCVFTLIIHCIRDQCLAAPLNKHQSRQSHGNMACILARKQVKTTCWSFTQASQLGRGDLSDFENGMVDGARSGSSKYFRNCWLAWIFPVNISKVYREYFRKYEVIVDARGHYWVAAQITTFLQVRHAEEHQHVEPWNDGRRPHHSC